MLKKKIKLAVISLLNFFLISLSPSALEIKIPLFYIIQPKLWSGQFQAKLQGFFCSLLGIIAFDNTLWSGQVLLPEDQADESTKALKRLNDKLAKDSLRSFVVQLNVGDGYTLAVKL